MNKNFPRHVAIFPISVVKEMTQLTARQIRYYEEQGLIKPARNEGNQRIFSLNDIERFTEIKSLIDQGVNIAGVKAILMTRRYDEENVVPNSKDRSMLRFTEEEWFELIEKYRAGGFS
ncbi:MerR family transcriptional regulator [Alkalihalobacterium chitinilyticum]|uniref:MerR family transcriptional regulator n=1 Tax=Alkalihalobacterium chitinilyticum TaxID=2980103 RepID=A0ABT5VGP2_9BACI|nr:MerR family transcriptional regulator [Alkalihalobacterium chitinilyticum]MDE5414635.1 MerR family transcriptional regulator [Alkalihalobacterium chitinilyticum]